MSIKPDQREMRRIYEKSIRLLDSSQSQLRHMQQVLKKAVIRLSSLSTPGDARIDAIIERVALSVNHKIDLVALEKQLDELFVLTNQAGGRPSELAAFKLSVAQAVDAIVDNDALDSYKRSLKALVSSQRDHQQLADDIVALFREVADSAASRQATIEDQQESVRIFADKLSSTIGCQIDSSAQTVDAVLAALSHELLPFVSQRLEAGEITALADDTLPANQLLIEVLNQLSLHDSLWPRRNSLKKQLSYQVDGADGWKKLINEVVDVINESINVLHAEKKELQTFVSRIIQQLADIEEYVQRTRKEAEESNSQSVQLNDSVNDDVERIQHSVSGASDIDALKKDVQCHLSNIRKNVEENTRLLELKEQQSKQGYQKMMQELASTQRESDRLKEQLRESQSQLLRDDLTGLPNRMAFNERIQAEYQRWQRSGSPLCVAMWDIDHFKQFNDNYGHDVGDRVLKIVANLIHSRIRKVDMFARYGGEEFVLLMPDTPLKDALVLNDDLRIMLSQADFHYNGEQCAITASVGIATFREGEDIEAVMKRADIALYQSKDAGRNRCTASEPQTEGD